MNITVAIITRNRVKSLRRLLKSLEIQTVTPLEFLIIDNSSTDLTKEVVKEFAKKFTSTRYIFERKIGIPFARNRALKEAKGQIIAFIDDDCETSPNWVENIIKAHKKYPKAAAILGKTFFKPENSVFATVTSIGYDKWLKENNLGKNRISILDTKNASFKKNTLTKLQLGFDTSLFQGEDADISKQLLNRNQELIYEPSITNIHWERTNIVDALKQKYKAGKYAATRNTKWGIELAPLKITNMNFHHIYPTLLSKLLALLKTAAWRKGYRDGKKNSSSSFQTYKFKPQQKKITVAIITRNRAKLLTLCLQSLTKQTITPLEILVIDNSSVDNTKDVIKDFKRLLPIQYILEKEVGTPFARNRALKEAKGQIIAFIDDDCETSPNWVENIIKAHKKYPKAAAILGKTFFKPENSVFATVTQNTYQKWLLLNTYQNNKLLICDTKNVSFKLQIIKKLKVQFDPRLHRLGEDVDFGNQLLNRNKEIIYEPSIVNIHRERTNLFGYLKQKYTQGKSLAERRAKWGNKFAPHKEGIELAKNFQPVIKGFFLHHLLCEIVEHLRSFAYNKGYKYQAHFNYLNLSSLGNRPPKSKVKFMETTVAIITRNRAGMLRRCLKSIVKQTNKINEVLIIDNGSTDKTKVIASNFKKKLPIKYVFEEQVGIPFARNRALKEAKGQILAFIDDDCEASPNWVENIIKFHSLYPKAVAIQGWSNSIPKTSPISVLSEFTHQSFIVNNIKNQAIKDKVQGSRTFREILRRGLTFPVTVLDTKNTSFKMRIIKKLKTEFDSKLHRRGADVDFGKKLSSLNQEIIFCPQVKVNHWERNSITKFLIQRFEFARGSATLRRTWGLDRIHFKLFRLRIRGLFQYCQLNGIKHRLIPALLILLFLDKLVTMWGHFFQNEQFKSKKIPVMDEKIIVKGAFWLSSTDLIQHLTHFLIISGIALLGPLYVGIFYLSTRLFHLAVGFLVGVLSIRFIPNLRSMIYNEEEEISTNLGEAIAYSLKFYFVYSLAIAFLVFLIFVPIASHFSLQIFPYLTFLILAFPFATIAYYILSILKLSQKFWQVMLIQVGLTLIVQIGLFIFLVKLISLSLLTVGLVQLITSVFVFVIGILFIFPLINPIGFFRGIPIKNYKLKPQVVLNFLALEITKIIDIVFVVILFGIQSLGLYVILLYLPLLMYSLVTASSGLFIHAARIKSQKGEEITTLSKLLIRFTAILAIPLFFIILLYQSQILSLIFHKQYLQEIQIIKLLTVAYFVQCFSWSVGIILIIKKKTEKYIASNILFGATLLLLMIITSSFGLTGIALSILFASIFDLLVKTSLQVKVNMFERLNFPTIRKKY